MDLINTEKMHTRQYKLETRRELNSCGKLELARHQFIGPLCISVRVFIVYVYISIKNWFDLNCFKWHRELL